MSRIVCYISKDGRVATCIKPEVKCHLCDVRIPDDARSSICDRGDNLPSDYQRGYEEGAKAERERVLDEVRDRCAEKMSECNPSITGVMLYYILSDLRSPGQKQEPE